jgi:galactokinase
LTISTSRSEPSAPVLDLARRFACRFGQAPRIYRAPGRVNVIGEHTDYNDGFVLPASLTLATFVAIAPRRDRRLRVVSLAFDATVEIDLDDPEPRPRRDWSDYVAGVALVLERAGSRLSGADMMIGGDLPMGAGLSSSAALEVATGFALASVSAVSVDLVALARWCNSAENEFVGMRCGIMDPLISCCAVEGHLMLIDCRSLEMRPVRLDPNVRLVVCDTMVQHELASGTYNIRREECEAGVALLSRMRAGVTALRDVSMADLTCCADLLPEPILRRCRHVVGENARVLEAVAALNHRDLARCGWLMNQSHDSLRDDYEVSCAELDLMVKIARDLPGVYGSRMTGGGFGGCTVSLVEAEAVDRFVESMGRTYRDATGKQPTIFVGSPGSGVEPVPLRGDPWNFCKPVPTGASTR